MASISNQTKPSKKKSSSKTRPASTSLLNAPSINGTASDAAGFDELTAPAALSAFSKDNSFLALLSQAIDRHRLRVFRVRLPPSAPESTAAVAETTLVADYIVPNDAKCNALRWITLPLQPNGAAPDTLEAEGKRKKRRKSQGEQEDTPSTEAGPSSETLLALGLDNGQTHIFSPLLGKVVSVLSDPDYAASVTGSHKSAPTLPLAALSVVAGLGQNRGILNLAAGSGADLWTASHDGVFRQYPLTKRSDSVKPVSRILPDTKTGAHIVSTQSEHLLAGHHSIRLFASKTSGEALSVPSTSLAHFTGHANPITHLEWFPNQPQRFISAAEEDRTLSIWQVPALGEASGSVEGKPVALITLDAPARHVVPLSSTGSGQDLLIVTHSGTAFVFSLPASLQQDPDASVGDVSLQDTPGLSKAERKKRRKSAAAAALPTLKPVSQIRLIAKKGGTTLPAMNVAADIKENGVVDVVIARLVRGSKLVLESINVRSNQSSPFAQQVEITRSAAESGSSSLFVSLDDGSEAHLGGGTSDLKRAANNDMSAAGNRLNGQSSASGSAAGAALSSTLGLGGGAIPSTKDLDAIADDQAELGEDDDEPSLAQRLKSLQMQNGTASTKKSKKGKKAVTAADDDEDQEAQADRPRALALGAGGFNSLAQALTQALHSNDASLLTSCLVHGEATLIRGTVARLSGPLAVRLLEHCIDRMQRGGTKITSKGQMGSQRARSLIEWIRVTLIIHMSYFMSLPNLVTRLFHLHSALMARLASQDKLLELHGRLELVLAQIELRATYAAEQADVQGVKKGVSRARKAAGKDARREAEERTQGQVWVESDADEEDDEMEVDDDEEDDVEAGEEEGEVQDIALGEDDDEESDSEEEDGSDLEGVNADDLAEFEAMEDNAVEDTPEPSDEEDGEDARAEGDDENYDSQLDSAGSLDDFVVEDDEDALDQEGDSDDVDGSDDDEAEDDMRERMAQARAGAKKRKSHSMLVDDEASETSDEGTGPDEDE